MLAVEDELDDYYEEDDDGQVPEESVTEMGVMQLLRQHREDADEPEEYFDDQEY